MKFQARSAIKWTLIALLTLNAPAHAAMLYQDNFESPISNSTNWFNPSAGGDNDPTTPVVGTLPWIAVEASDLGMQEVSHPQNLTPPFASPPSFAPSATGGNQYLHMIRPTSQAWAPLSPAEQGVIAGNGVVELSVELFGLSGYDGWHSELRIAAFDSAATVGTNAAFDILFVETSYATNSVGTVKYVGPGGITNTLAGFVHKPNQWQTLTIKADFNTDTFSLTLDSMTTNGLALASGDMSTIQSLLLTMGSTTGGGPGDVRGGFDNFALSSSIPEPSTFALLAGGGLLIARRRFWLRREHD